MPLRVGAVVLKVHDVERASRFWRQALDYLPNPGNRAFLASRDGAGVEIHLDDDDTTLLDLWALESDDVSTEVQRLVDAGAQRVDWDYPADADFVVLRDTEGNLFCVVDASPGR